MNGFQHLALNCTNPHDLEKFYTEHFGFRKARVFNAGTPNEFRMIRLGGMCLELFRLPSEGVADRSEKPAPGFTHLAFEVDDIEAKARELESAGIKMLFPIQDHSHVTPGLKVTFFRDPDGNLIELMESWKDQEGLS